MGSIRLLLGRTRLRRRKALAGLGATDALGRPGFLYVTDTLRKRDQVLREFEGRDAFQPAVRVLSELAASLWHRYGDGRALYTPRALELAARRLLHDQGDRWPRLKQIGPGPELAAALARLEQRLAAHRIAEVDDAVGTLRARLDASPDHVRPSVAYEALLRLLEAPTPALLEWLRRFPVVLLDDLIQPTPLEVALVIRLCRAWAAAGAHVVLAFESGRDRGGREAGILLGWDPDLQVPREARVLAATVDLRRAAMEELVASGEARVQVATTAAVLDVEPWTEPGPEGARDLADAFADGEAVPAAWLPDPKVALVRCADPSEEARTVARAVKEALLGGSDPRDCLVALADPASTASLLQAALDDHGVPYAMGGGVALGSLPLALAVRRVAARQDPCALADRVGMALPIEPRRLKRWCAAAGIRSDDVQAWRRPLHAWLARTGGDFAALDGTLDALEAWLAPLAALEGPLDPMAWHRALLDALEALGVPASCGDDPVQLHTWAAIVELLDRLALDLLAAHAGPWPAEVLVEQLERALASTGIDPTPRSVARVPVVGVRELRGLTPEHTWVLGLSRGAFPRPRAASYLTEQRLDPDPMAEARFLLGSLLRNAAEEPWMRSVTLSWPATRGGTPVPPSPVLADLLDLSTDAGVPLSALAVRSPAQGPPASVSEALAAGPAWAAVLPPAAAEKLEDQAATVAARLGPAGPHDGLLDHPPAPPAHLPVTALEAYLKCPQRYWYDRVLDLAPLDAWEPELEPRRRGTALHRILERFVAEGGGGAEVLHRVAEQVLDEVERQGGFDPAFQAYARSRWLAGLVDELPGGILRAWLDHEAAADPPVQTVAVEEGFRDLPVGPLRLRGVLDRLDRLPAGLLVTDYKTGATPSRRAVLSGLALQPVAYAEAVARAHPDTPVAATFLSLRRPDALQRRAWVGDAAVLDQACTASERRYAVALDAAGRHQVMEVAAEAARDLVAGRFPTTPHGPADAGCASCPHARVCRVDHARNARLREEA